MGIPSFGYNKNVFKLGWHPLESSLRQNLANPDGPKCAHLPLLLGRCDTTCLHNGLMYLTHAMLSLVRKLVLTVIRNSKSFTARR